MSDSEESLDYDSDSTICLNDLSESLIESTSGHRARAQSTAAAKAAKKALKVAKQLNISNNTNKPNRDKKDKGSRQKNYRQGRPGTSRKPAEKRSRPNSESDSDTEGPPKRAKRVPEALESTFRRLRATKEKHLRFTHHWEYLKKYLSEGKAPKGLVPVIKPSIGTVDEAFQARWDSILAECSLRLLQASIDKCLQQLEILEPEITALESQLKAQATSATEEKETLEFIEELVARRAALLIDRKDKKFEADKAGTRNKKVAKPQQQRRKRPNAFSFLQDLVENLHKSLNKK